MKGKGRGWRRHFDNPYANN